ncbi:hypothetical protein HGG71_05915 [Rhodobacteraceae bacterium R_SAG2]|nr:hypothetical protein [Rhodobacteraceae bacterium R_SAG2]
MSISTRRSVSAVAALAAVLVSACAAPTPQSASNASYKASATDNPSVTRVGGNNVVDLDTWTSHKNLGTPADIYATRDAYFANNPGSNTFSITKRGIMSFNFHRDGSAEMYYMGSRKPITVPVTVGAVRGNTVCFQKTGKFHGGCVSLFKAPSGGYMADTVFGNGQMRTFKAYGLTG